MAKKKKIKVPFHIQNDYKQYSYKDGGLTITFWAKDDTDAELYRKKQELKQMFEFLVVCLLAYIAFKMWDNDSKNRPMF